MTSLHQDPIPHTLFADPAQGEQGIQIHGWSIKTTKRPISNAAQLEADEAHVRIPFPEMYFGQNRCDLEHTSGAQISFTALNALRGVDDNPNAAQLLQVSCAQAWAKSRDQAGSAISVIRGIAKPYDWTYTTYYAGDGCVVPVRVGEFVEVGTSTSPKTYPLPFQSANPEKDRLDTELLKRRDPILFYDQLLLYEDELADHGAAISSMRLRVMPSCFLVLLSFFLRIDHVMFRIVETRYFHKFGESKLIREKTVREADYASVRQVTTLHHTQQGPHLSRDRA
ncbi:hypothetical protein CXG81DRAFT_14302 [Caulochytrium protostelioides]|uniref:TIP41-domain-containing protein n=1 Tax=Caulochytrium protostelioides TaxID=1555241 RepID=A0A4P9X3H9_9FUNG|nr:hypothetical protein CXG81DRAFT_14302 [Caulochytrium protostelioides]|eukprot:RKO99585.1 hypothetical protein CXG81DRAFT_14302 [Caulochytrium protostelioides]